MSAIRNSNDKPPAISLFTTFKRNEWAALRHRLINLNDRNRHDDANE
jgi:hypothetical protein